jgi:hypothetical protein
MVQSVYWKLNKYTIIKDKGKAIPVTGREDP